MICFSYNYNYVTEHSAKNPFKKETVSQPKRQGFGRSGIGQGCGYVPNSLLTERTATPSPDEDDRSGMVC